MKQVRHQVAAPQTRMQKLQAEHPGKHFVIAEREIRGNPDYVSPIEEMLENGYELVGGKETTGKERLAVLAIDQKEYDRRQAEIVSESREAAKPGRRKENIGDTEGWEEAKTGAALSHKGLEALVAQNDSQPSA